jgi:hypothetical protein
MPPALVAATGAPADERRATPWPPAYVAPGVADARPHIPPVPEPGTAALALIGLAWIARALQRRAGTPN